ncbi:MAG: hypothetical protein AAB880_00255, partial [Patescibacteria group bacterium]
MPVLGVPDVVVLEPVDVHVERPAVVEVDIGNEKTRNLPSRALPPEIAKRLYFIRDIKVPQQTAPTV